MPEFRTQPIITEAVSGLLPQADRDAKRVPGPAAAPGDAGRVPTREVICYECGHRCQVPKAALSGNCSHCHAHLKLADVELKPGSKRLTVRTIGNVYVPTETTLTGADVICNNLTMLGRVSGTFRVRGTASIASSTSITEIAADKLIIEKGAEVTLEHGAKLREAEIYGTLRGNLLVEQRVHLHSRCQLIGDCRCAERILERGAVHSGIFLRTAPGN